VSPAPHFGDLSTQFIPVNGKKNTRALAQISAQAAVRNSDPFLTLILT